MSLNVYEEKCVPESLQVVEESGRFFDLHTTIPNTELARTILRDLDKAEYISDTQFKSLIKPEWGALDKKYLSIGVKLLFNVMQHPDICFGTKEMSDIVADKMVTLKSGNIVYRRFYLFRLKADTDLDILANGKYPCKRFKMLVKKMKEMPFEYPDYY